MESKAGFCFRASFWFAHILYVVFKDRFGSTTVTRFNTYHTVDGSEILLTTLLYVKSYENIGYFQYQLVSQSSETSIVSTVSTDFPIFTPPFSLMEMFPS